MTTFRVGQFVTLAKEIGPWPVGTTAQIKKNPVSVKAESACNFQYAHSKKEIVKTFLIAVLTKNPSNYIESFTVFEEEIAPANARRTANND